MLTQCTSSTTTRPTPIERSIVRNSARRSRSGAAYTSRFPPAATSARREAVSSAGSDELTNVAVGATAGGSLST